MPSPCCLQRQSTREGEWRQEKQNKTKWLGGSWTRCSLSKDTVPSKTATRLPDTRWTRRRPLQVLSSSCACFSAPPLWPSLDALSTYVTGSNCIVREVILKPDTWILSHLNLYILITWAFFLDWVSLLDILLFLSHLNHILMNHLRLSLVSLKYNLDT